MTLPNGLARIPGATRHRLGVMGGTFDPIHDGHLALAREAAARFRLDRVLFVPAAHPPHKAGVTHASYADRVRMAELACQGDPRFEVSRIEEDTARSYSIDTIEKLRARLAPELVPSMLRRYRSDAIRHARVLVAAGPLVVIGDILG